VSAKFDVKLRGERVQVELYGALDGPAARGVQAEVARMTQALTPGGFEVLFQLSGASRCSLDARIVLAELQKDLAGRARRTAYVDERPVMRGMALWVMHLAGDANAKAVATLAQAEQWLRGTGGRQALAPPQTVAA